MLYNLSGGSVVPFLPPATAPSRICIGTIKLSRTFGISHCLQRLLAVRRGLQLCLKTKVQHWNHNMLACVVYKYCQQKLLLYKLANGWCSCSNCTATLSNLRCGIIQPMSPSPRTWCLHILETCINRKSPNRPTSIAFTIALLSKCSSSRLCRHTLYLYWVTSCQR